MTDNATDDLPNLTRLFVKAVSQEARSLLKRGLTTALARLDPPAPAPVAEPVAPRRRPQVEPVGVPHKTVREAIAETDAHLQEIRRETRERKMWQYIAVENFTVHAMTDGSIADLDVVPNDEQARTMAIRHFGQPEGTTTVVGINTTGRKLIAVWDANEHGPTPTTEPTFE